MVQEIFSGYRKEPVLKILLDILVELFPFPMLCWSSNSNFLSKFLGQKSALNNKPLENLVDVLSCLLFSFQATCFGKHVRYGVSWWFTDVKNPTSFQVFSLG